MSNLIEKFVAEARDLTKALVDGLLALEKSPAEPAMIEQCFRAMHTLKGSSGIFEIPPFTHLTHTAEDLLDRHRDSGEPLNSDAIDQLLAVTDQLIDWIDDLENDGTLPEDAAGVTERMQGELAAFIEKSGDEETPEESTGPTLADVSIEDVLGPDSERLASAKGEDGLQRIAIRYQPGSQVFFSGDDPVLLWSKLPDLIDWSIFPAKPWAEGEEFDPYDCNIVLTGVSTAPREELEHLFRYVPEEVMLVDLPGEDAAAPQAAPPPEVQASAPAGAPAQKLGADMIKLAKAVLNHQNAVIASAVEGEDTSQGKLASVANVLQGIKARMAGQASEVSVPSVDDIATNADARPKLEQALTALKQSIEASGQEPQPSGQTDPGEAAEPQAAPSAEAKPKPELSVVPDSGKQNAAPKTAPKAAPENRPNAPRSYIRVEESRLDMMMNLIGELVVAKNALPYLATQATEVHDCPMLSRQISQQYTIVDRLAHEMQTAILQLRMLPISEVFERFPRLVRDVSRKIGKKVELSIQGADSEVDKTIVEALSDPLIHIVRNSLDHGLETVEERRAFGKTDNGNLIISAETEADQLIVKVIDDGRGIDAEKLRSKAIEKGMLTPEEAEALSEEESLELIFRSGFSTKTEVSDLSGRGVGMDVAMTSIQSLGGRISVSSENGRGTTVRLALPLSMAISRIVVVGIGEERYGIPMDMISQMVQIDQSEIKIIQGQESFLLRGQVVPIMRMKELLGQSSGDTEHSEQEAIIITSIRNRLLGFVVDDLRERMETIVKPMEGVISGLPGFMGTSLMGDGSVLLVVNPEELVHAHAA